MTRPSIAAVPDSFRAYLRTLGPGLIVVMTWLGAGDIVEMSVAGGNYGYALMWVVVVAVAMRFLFVSLIAKYQLCNERGEGVLDGLARLHPLYPPVILFAAVLMGHAYGSYMTVGLGESTANLLDTGEAWQWALLWNGLALALVFRPVYRHVELVFKLLLGLLTVAVLGTAAWVGPRPDAVLTGLVTVQIPEQHGAFGPLLIMVGMIGAVGGSLMNLVYPYFLEDKGWCQPVHRRVQTYDFLLGVVVMVVLNLAVWTLGAELLHPTGRTVEKLDDLPRLLSEVLGNAGRALFYLGIFAAIYTSLIGHALGLARLGAHGYLRWQAGSGELYADYRTHFMYRAITVWILVSPLVWTHPAMPDFVTLTLVVQSGQVILIPLLAGGLWWITASPRYIGTVHRNRLWENLVMGVLLLVALWAACQSVRSLWTVLFPGT